MLLEGNLFCDGCKGYIQKDLEVYLCAGGKAVHITKACLQCVKEELSRIGLGDPYPLLYCPSRPNST